MNFTPQSQDGLQAAISAASNVTQLLLQAQSFPAPVPPSDELERALASALDCVVLLKGALEQSHGASISWQPSFAATFCQSVTFDSPSILRVSLPDPPITKGNRNLANAYANLTGLEIAQRIRAQLPKDFHLFRQVYVIYAHHDVLNHAQPYYDNDNLSIKAILDSVLPAVCVDDAARYCSNVYLFVPDERQYTDLFVVERSHLAEWVAQHPNLPLSKDLLPLRG